jgi:hypothetical protein
VREMSDASGNRSPELNRVRQLLFPKLSAEEGWARIDAAISGAADTRRTEAIERLAAGSLSDDLLTLLKLLREEQGA